MKKNPLTIAIGLVLLVIFGLLLFMFQVRKGEVAVVTRFGGAPRAVTQPGGYFKWPWPVEKVHKFDQRTHTLEGKFETVLTSDGYNLLISVYVGWRISEPRVFLNRFEGGSIRKAEESLEGAVRNAYSGVAGQRPFSHFISTEEKELKFLEIEQDMLQRVQKDAKANGYGVDVVFLGIRRLGLPESVTESVFDRMRSERQVLVSTIQFEGEREARTLRENANLQSARILADAEAEATRIRGEGESKAAETFAVFQKEPDLANFLLKLTGLENFLKERAILILDPQTSPIDLLKPSAPKER